MCTPVTSWPAAATRAAATAESTPPDMAASTRRVMTPQGYVPCAQDRSPDAGTAYDLLAMSFFRRAGDNAPSPNSAIAEFWDWWAQARPRIEAAAFAEPSPDASATPEAAGAPDDTAAAGGL